MTDSYEPERMGYEAPNVLQFLKAPSSFLRGQYSTNFADLVSNDAEVHDAYKDGLVALSSFIGGFIIIWGLVLVFFMIKGKAVGCASGRAFELSAREENTQKGPIASSNSSADDSHSAKEEEEIGMETTSFSSSLCSSDAASRFESVTSFDNCTVDASPRLEGRRAMRTRLAFFLFACTVLGCVPLALAFSFAPMKETAKSFDGAFSEAEDVIGQVRAALNTISTASQSAMGILSQTSTNSTIFCPNINATSFDKRLGQNLLRLSQLLSIEYVALQRAISDNMTDVEDVLETFEDAADMIESSFDRAESVIWFVPGLLLAVSIVTALATFGVILAWKQESGLRLQRCMSYGVLPALTTLCVLCWILGIATTVTTALSADFCLSGTSSGSPDITIRNMLLTHGDLQNSTKHQFIGAYTSGCTGSEPSLLIVELERASQDKVDEIWAHISSVDSFGRSALSEECGGAGLDELLSASRNIAKLLTKVRRALDSASDSLVCNRIDPLYTATMHGSICTDFAEASAWGAITFCLLGVSMLTLITLRASWRVNIDEDKIYHDESEVAENMVVDEHEEYLRYISKYRHEWQEYNGFGSTSMRQSTSFSASEDEGDDRNFDVRSGSASTASGSTRPQEGLVEDETSIDSGAISFPSLDVPPTDDSSADQSQVVPMPPPLLVDRRGRPPHSPVHNQEVMLCTKTSSRSREQNPGLRRRAVENKEEEKAEVNSESVDNNVDEASENTEESTDFSSIGKNAGMGAGLYWKNQLGLGIEVINVSSVSDSLVVSPNSDGGLTSFDLTKTPSPKRPIASFDVLTDQVPTPRSSSFAQKLYVKKSADEQDDMAEIKRDQKEASPLKSPRTRRIRTDPLPRCVVSNKKLTAGSTDLTREPHKPQPKTFLAQTENLAVSSRIASRQPSANSTRRHQSGASSAPTQSAELQLDSLLVSGAVAFMDERSTRKILQTDSSLRKKTTHSSNADTKNVDHSKTPKRAKRKLMHLMHKFDPKAVVAPDDLQTI